MTATGGCLQLNDGVLRYEKDGIISWAMPAEQIVIVAEYTTADGPFADDHFWAFIRPDGSWVCAPFEALDRANYLRLAQHFDAALTTGLANKASWASRVIWPVALQGQMAFVRHARRPDGIAMKALSLIGFEHTDITLSPDVRRFLRLDVREVHLHRRRW